MSSVPYSSTSQCTGRTNSAVDAPQRMRFGIGSASSERCTMPASRLAVCWPGLLPSKYRNSPLPSVTRVSAPTSTPHFSANLSAAGAGCAVLAEGRADRRALELDGLRRLRGGEIAHQHRQATRRGEGTQFAVRQRWLRRGPCECLRQMLLRAPATPAAAAPRCRPRPENRAASLMPAPCRWPASESRVPRGCRNRPAPPRAPWCARAGCSAGVR